MLVIAKVMLSMLFKRHLEINNFIDVKYTSSYHRLSRMLCYYIFLLQNIVLVHGEIKLTPSFEYLQ